MAISGKLQGAVISVVTTIMTFIFGSQETLLNPTFQQQIWTTAIGIPYLGQYILQYLNPALLLAIVSFILIWLCLLGFMKVFGHIALILLIGVGFLLALIFLGILTPSQIMQYLSVGLSL